MAATPRRFFGASVTALLVVLAPAGAVAATVLVSEHVAAARVPAHAAPSVNRSDTSRGKGGGTARGLSVVHPASVGCYGTSCNGLQPDVEGCRADAIQIGGISVTDPVADYTLWHSPACHSAWAEYDSKESSTRVERLEFMEQYGTNPDAYQISVAGSGNSQTPMVTWDDSVQMCDGTFVLPQYCTEWR